MAEDFLETDRLAVAYRPVGELRPDPRNARTHPKRQTDQIVASIRAFRFANPILIDEADTIIAGRGRLLAAKALAMADVPTLYFMASMTPASARSGLPTTRSP